MRLGLVLSIAVIGCGHRAFVASDGPNAAVDGLAADTIVIDHDGAVDAAPDSSRDAAPDVPADAAVIGICASPCALGEACALDTDCASAACDSVTLTCVADRCADHHRDGLETDTDCGDGICGACAIGAMCTTNVQCASGACDALTDRCIANGCSDHQHDSNETDVDCGGVNTCARCAVGKTCAHNFDCRPGLVCTQSVCAAWTCANGQLDTGETDVDCGGATCPKCALGKQCEAASDCATNACSAGSHTCIASACSDGAQDGDETGIDCGGSCTPCPLGSGCAVDADCATGACDALSRRCVTDRCTDHHTDGAETDIDCGGGSCGACTLQRGCTIGSDCTTNACDAIARICVAPTCIDGTRDGNETDVDCGGSCASCGLGQSCAIDQDCASKACDSISRTCIATQCSDHHQEAAESDLDCGGPCPPCVLGQGCVTGSDCTTNTCDSSNGTCHLPWCADGTQDEGETGVDCGGGMCPGCPVGGGCLIDGDCALGACDAQLQQCVADACFDHRADGDETWTDCGGTTCTARCAVGDPCIHDSDCEAGHTCNLVIHLCL
jgi:hypothetical protein